MKRITSIIFLSFLTALTICLKAQGPVLFDCPQYPSYAFFDRSCLIKTAAPYGEIRLPQGGVDGLNEERPMHLSIPTNKPTWALGIAHAWNYNRNIIQRVDHPKISYWMAITGHETGMACDCSAQWPANRTPWNSLSPAFNAKCSEGLTQHDGCFQMEEANAWCGDLNQTWPWRFKPNEHQQFISTSHFSTACLGLAYRNILNHYLIDYAWGVDIWPIITATQDPNAYEKLMASGWNSWAAAVQDNVSGTAGGGQGFNLYTAAGRAAAIASCNWDLTATASRYPEVIGWSMNALEQNTTSCYYKYDNPVVTSTTAAAQNHVDYGHYNANITWADVTQYLSEVFPFYSELTPAQNAATTANVQAVFNSLNGGAPVPFKQIGPVIDEIILGLPKEIPLMSVIHNDGLPAYNNGYRQCIGDYAPASHISNISGSDTICKGQSVILEGMIDGGDGPNLTYSWFKDGIATGGNTKQLVITPNALGNFVYTLDVCNTDLGGCAPACCPKTLVVQDCNTCAIVATATTVNTPCQNMHGGKINLNIAGSGNYTITYASDEFSGSQTGTTAAVSINNIPDGVYNITIQDNNTPTCKFKLSAEVKFTTPMNEKLTASIQSMTSCDAILNTKLEQDDCECEWSVYFDTPYAAWERDVFVIITPSNGSALRLRKDVLVNAYPAPTKATFKMCTGEHIKFEVEVQPSSGSCTGVASYNEQNAPIEVYIKNSAGVQVLYQLIPIKTATQYNNYVAFDYVVSCPYTPGNYTYLWNPGNIAGTPVNVSGTVPTTYTVIATNTANPQCTLTDDILVPFNCNTSCVKPKAVVSGSDSICVGDSAQISIALTGTQPFKIKLSNGATKWTVDNINSNNYTFFAKNPGTYKVDSVWNLTCDTLGTDSAVINIVNLNVNLGNDTAFCIGSNLILDAGNGYSSYLWKGGSSASTLSIDSAGQYYVAVTNSLGCEANDTINLSLLPQPSINFGSDTLSICTGKNILLSPVFNGGSGALTYLWSGLGSGTAATFNANTQGYYYAEVTDSKGCKSEDSVYVKENSTLNIHLSDSTICVGDTLKLNALYDENDFTILWNTTASTQYINVTTPGIYGVVVDDGNGCSGSDSMTLSLYPVANVDLGADQNICTGTTTSINAAAGYASYQWSTGENAPTIIKGAGIYDVLVTDANGCKDRDTININELPDPVVDLGNDTSFCPGGNITLNAGAGYSLYAWTSGGSSASQLVDSIGEYIVNVTDSIGCKASDTINIGLLPLPVITFTSDTLLTCPGKSILLSPTITGGTGTLSYVWSGLGNGTAATFNSAGQGFYKITTSDSKGCVNTDSVYVAFNSNLLIHLSDSIICVGDTLILNSGFDPLTSTITWNTSAITQSIKVTVPGIYGVVVDDGNGCTGSDSMTLSMYPQPNIDLGNDAVICSGTEMTINAAGGFNTYKWSTGETIQAINKGVGTYDIVVIDNNGCKARDTISIDTISNPVVFIGKDVDTCFGNSVILTPQTTDPAWTYLWSDNTVASSLTINQTGNYSLTVSDINGCKGSDTLMADFRLAPSVDLLGGADTVIICEGESLTLDAENPGSGITYLWNSVSGSHSKEASQSGNYEVIVSNGKCSDTDKVYLQEVVLPKGVLNDSINPILPSYCFDDDVPIALSAFVKDGNTYSYLWNTLETSRDIMITEEGTYSVIINMGKCAVSDEVTIRDYCTTSFFVPNSFTPNGDNKNEIFYAVGEHIEDFQLQIFNRWGELIYSSKDILEGWDGKYHNETVQQDVYVWKVGYSINLPNGNSMTKERIGHVSVIY